MVSRPTYIGGLGFGMKWDMGWMHDTLDYMELDPVHRKFHHDELTFRRIYAYYGELRPAAVPRRGRAREGLADREDAGDDAWQKFANLRLLFGYMWAQPGKKLLFMGGEFGQWREWNHDTSLDWHLLEQPRHAGVQPLGPGPEPAATPRSRRSTSSTSTRAGSSGSTATTRDYSVVSLVRRGKTPATSGSSRSSTSRPSRATAIASASPAAGDWTEIGNSDAPSYGGSGVGNLGGAVALGGPGPRPLPQPRADAAAARGRVPQAACPRRTSPRWKRPMRRPGST